MIVGCGALGSMVAMQLSGCGVGTIGISDFDTIEISNLQRQFFFKDNEAGKLKSLILEKRMKELNPEVQITRFDSLTTEKIAKKIFKDYDFIVDATDNPESKLMIGKICKELKIPCCIGGVKDFSGQIITFNPEDKRFEEYFGDTDQGGFLPCSLGGVAGPAAALCASVQSAEVMKFLTKSGETLTGKLFHFDLLNCRFKVYEL